MRKILLLSLLLGVLFSRLSHANFCFQVMRGPVRLGLRGITQIHTNILKNKHYSTKRHDYHIVENSLDLVALLDTAEHLQYQKEIGQAILEMNEDPNKITVIKDQTVTVWGRDTFRNWLLTFQDLKLRTKATENGIFLSSSQEAQSYLFHLMRTGDLSQRSGLPPWVLNALQNEWIFFEESLAWENTVFQAVKRLEQDGLNLLPPEIENLGFSGDITSVLNNFILLEEDLTPETAGQAAKESAFWYLHDLRAGHLPIKIDLQFDEAKAESNIVNGGTDWWEHGGVSVQGGAHHSFSILTWLYKIAFAEKRVDMIKKTSRNSPLFSKLSAYDLKALTIYLASYPEQADFLLNSEQKEAQIK